MHEDRTSLSPTFPERDPGDETDNVEPEALSDEEIAAFLAACVETS